MTRLGFNRQIGRQQGSMQNGSLIRAKRRRGADVWEYRWREPGRDGRRRHRRIVVGSDALRAIAALQHDINRADGQQGNRAITVLELFDHYRQRELGNGNRSKTPCTKHTYEGYITKWICPRWGSFPRARVRAGEVEQWLHSLPPEPASCAKIRNVMSVLFNHAIRHDLFDPNPIRRVRQSAKRTKTPTVLSVSEIKSLLPALGCRLAQAQPAFQNISGQHFSTHDGKPGMMVVVHSVS